jgi:hypothetical protein
VETAQNQANKEKALEEKLRQVMRAKTGTGGKCGKCGYREFTRASEQCRTHNNRKPTL